jgi:hypothetical protein
MTCGVCVRVICRQYAFVVIFSTFLLECVNYEILFDDFRHLNSTHGHKVSLSDAFLEPGQCLAG